MAMMETLTTHHCHQALVIHYQRLHFFICRLFFFVHSYDSARRWCMKTEKKKIRL